MTTHVLVLCTHNSARSVLAEGMLNQLAAPAARSHWCSTPGSTCCCTSFDLCTLSQVDLGQRAVQALRRAGAGEDDRVRRRAARRMRCDGAPGGDARPPWHQP